MTDQQFKTELHIRAYIDQIAGYPFGHPARRDFRPIVAFAGSSEKPNRKATLELPCYAEAFTAEQKALLLEES
jgi:hypothetical protein